MYIWKTRICLYSTQCSASFQHQYREYVTLKQVIENDSESATKIYFHIEELSGFRVYIQSVRIITREILIVTYM